MIINAYSVKDKQSGEYLAPFFQPTHGVAIRSFGDIVKDPQSLQYKHPEDYTLFYIGEFNTENGQILSIESPQILSEAKEHKEKE